MKDVKGSTPALKPQKISHKTTDRCRHSNNIIHAASSSSSKTVKLYTNMKKEKDSSAGAIINAADASGHVEFLRLAACQNFFTSPQPNSKQSTSPCVTTIDVKKLKTWQKTFNKKSELMLMRHARAYGSSCNPWKFAECRVYSFFAKPKNTSWADGRSRRSRFPLKRSLYILLDTPSETLQK